MKRCLAAGSLFFLITVLSSGAQAQPSEALFKSYIQEYKSPELFQNNDEAFAARLKLLAEAPAGATVKIATFTFDNGRAVQNLSKQLCVASQRGVRVSLLVDSKSGDEMGKEGPFNILPDSKVAEQLYQYMANCGVRVYIHNSFDDYIEYAGQRLPNIFGENTHQAMKGKTVSFINLGSCILDIIRQIAGLADTALSGQGAFVDTQSFMQNVQNLAVDYITLKNDDGAAAAIAKFSLDYKNLVFDPAWKKATSAQILNALPVIVDQFKSYPDVRDVFAQARRFNRLNHRKLFLVELPSGEGCFFLGGRNLGDSYLRSNPGAPSFFDGDILFCRHHSAANLMHDAEGSFDTLISDHTDPLLDPSVLGSGPGSPAYNNVRLVKKNTSQVLNAIGEAVRTPPSSWPDAAALHGDFMLDHGSNWRLLKAGWSTNPKADEVKTALLAMIQNEQREIYIETAYAEFDRTLCSALEKALQRGVRVKIVTNDFALSDGNSRLIRILMAHWENKMKVQYPGTVSFYIPTANEGHMTHFKGAGFRCQKNGSFHKSFIVGSHNFHPRSGRSDKEHSLAWDEPADSSCATSADGSMNDLIGARDSFYQAKRMELMQRSGRLMEFHTLFDELVSAASGVAVDKYGAFLAQVFKQVIYSDAAGTPRFGPELENVLEMLDKSGLRDLVGNTL